MQYASGKHFQGKRWRDVMSGLGERWVEPFCGGLGAFVEMSTAYDKALLSDISPVAMMWAAAKSGWRPEIESVTTEEFKRHVAIARGDGPTPESVYVSHAGAVRGSPKKGASKTNRVKSGHSRFEKVAQALVRVDAEIRQCDYKNTLRETGAGDVVYLDPPYQSKGDWLDGKSTFDLSEMMSEAEMAIERGAVVFISHYDELPVDKWVVIDVHRDQSPVPNSNVVKITNEYLYINVGAYHKHEWSEWKVEGKRKTRINRTSEQSRTRKKLLEMIGFRCEATGRIYPDARRLELAHDPSVSWSKTGKSGLEFCYLLSKSVHAEFEEDGGVSILNGKWEVREDLRFDPDFKGTHGALCKRFRASATTKAVA